MVRFLIYALNFVFALVVTWLISRFWREVTGRGAGAQRGPNEFRRRPQHAVHGETSRDPVCGMFVSTEVSHRLERNGTTLHFCSAECLKKYELEARPS